MISKMYGQALVGLASGAINFISGTPKVMLTSGLYVPNQDTNAFVSDVTNEVVDATYSRTVLAALTSVYDAPTNTLKLSCGDVTWAAATFTAAYAVFFCTGGSDAASPLLCYWDFGGDVPGAGSNFVLQINAAGLITAVTA